MNPPNDVEFSRFKSGLAKILKVSKAELQQRMKEEKRKPKASASRASDASPKSAT